MPMYEYSCVDCGNEYTQLRPIAERNNPSCCPLCNNEGIKVVLTAPRTGILSKNNRIAHETNERSRHEPKTLNQFKEARHGAGCSCCSGARGKPKSPDGTPALKTAGTRPWMISH